MKKRSPNGDLLNYVSNIPSSHTWLKFAIAVVIMDNLCFKNLFFCIELRYDFCFPVVLYKLPLLMVESLDLNRYIIIPECIWHSIICECRIFGIQRILDVINRTFDDFCGGIRYKTHPSTRDVQCENHALPYLALSQSRYNLTTFE